MKTKPNGFTLLEVLLAFAILLTGLTLVLQIFGRHLHVVERLSASLTALHLADDQLIGEALRRGENLIVTSPSQDNFTAALKVESVQLDQEPLKNFTLDQATADVAWELRKEPRSMHLKAGFQSKSSP